MFCDQARKWIGSFAAALGGVDTLVFAAGIGENRRSSGSGTATDSALWASNWSVGRRGSRRRYECAGAGLYRAGIPKDSILNYETQIKAGKFVVIIRWQ
jgi:acetokinase family protein